MKKYIKLAAAFAAAGIVGGVFYREFSKFHGVDNDFSILGLVHPHFLVLGVIMILMIGLVDGKMNPAGKLPGIGLTCYSVGTAGAGVMLFIRGIFDVLSRADAAYSIGKGLSAAISGISGLFHIALGVGLTMIFVAWLKCKE